MKHTLLKSAVVLALAALSTEALADPKISGRIYAYSPMETTETKTTGADGKVTTTKETTRATINTAGSRIRVSATEKINDQADFEYLVEYGIYLDSENKKDDITNNLISRNAYVGLKHKDMGTVRIGRIYTPDDDIDYVHLGYLASAGAGGSMTYFGQRTNNTIQYITPKFNDGKTQIKLHYAIDEDKKAYPAIDAETKAPSKKSSSNNNGGAVTTHDANGKKSTAYRDLAAAHILHSGDNFTAGLAYTQAGSDFNAVRGMVSYDVTKELTLGVMGQRVDYKTKTPEIGVTGSVSYNLTDTLNIYGQAGHAVNQGGVKDKSHTSATTGVVKWLKKEGSAKMRTFVSASYANENDKNAKKVSNTYSVETGLRVDF